MITTIGGVILNDLEESMTQKGHRLVKLLIENNEYALKGELVTQKIEVTVWGDKVDLIIGKIKKGDFIVCTAKIRSTEREHNDKIYYDYNLNLDYIDLHHSQTVVKEDIITKPTDPMPNSQAEDVPF